MTSNIIALAFNALAAISPVAFEPAVSLKALASFFCKETTELAASQ
jgi:hypothetical protein